MQSPISSFSLLDDSPLESATLHRALGSGRHGTVFLGQIGQPTEEGVPPQGLPHENLVAIKIASTDTDITVEAEALARLAHPNIVKVISAEPPSTLAVEYCSGGTLNDLIVAAPLSLHELRYVFHGVTEALQHIHAMGWIHGDISPSNIGIRPVGGAALFDFSTARSADGKALIQGTEDWSGPNRLAEPSFDVRCAAAVALRALGEGSFEPQVVATLASLDGIVQQVDSGATVAIDDLRVALGLGTTTRISPDMPHRLGGGGAPPASTTRDFGPRPGGQSGNDETTASSRSRLPVVLAIIALLAVIAALAVEFLLPSTAEPAQSSPNPLLVERLVAAESTIAANNAIWDSASGTLTTSLSGEAELWKVGEPGDLAAIADWSCTGIPTLGVFRPSDGTWFTFSNWSAGATSTVQHLATGQPATTLDVRMRIDGCATPAVS